ncbi:hypothetical protein [Streptomyces noursei]|uniref:hypothetical protein n=1 Tax=Streptomyces noursei TaxID=1971 RepID=UPI0016771432|nr:hypothetical protein [Streptomyces noursei]MCZ1021388.1 hypothetical protein [Streptomyces noursei]GGX56359.1 hypothetical protein GCM10010341_91120 [Streptomyces noursei]
MIAVHQVQLQLPHWQRMLPAEVAVPDRTAPVTRAALVRVIRAELLPFITFGPSYNRAVAENLRRALDMYCRGWGQEFVYWLGEALRAGVQARTSVAEPFVPEARVVTATAWGVSYRTGGGVEGARLSVHDFDETAPNAWGGTGVSVRHPVYDGLRFRSVTEAKEFAYRAGLLRRYVSHRAPAAQA